MNEIKQMNGQRYLLSCFCNWEKTMFHPRTESCTTTAHINADNAMIEMKVRPQFISDAGIATDCHQLPQPFAKINTEVLKFCFWQFASCCGAWRGRDPRPILNLASHQSMAHICNFSSKAIQTLIKILLLNFPHLEYITWELSVFYLTLQ